MDRKWGLLTVAFVLALAVCAWWIAITAPSKDAGLLKWQFVVVELVLVALCIFAGLLVNSRMDGILIDDRNKISLSRFQWVVWVILILGGYYAEAIWNMSNGFSFPVIQTQLLALLGISSGSAVVSNIITDSKKATPPTTAPVVAAPAAPAAAGAPAPAAVPAPAALHADPAVIARSPLRVGSMVANTTAVQASWRDMFVGDEVATDQTVDISRLQKLIITILLAAAFMTFLWKALGDVGAAKGLLMPSFGEDSTGFLWLLGISHGAYLAQKAAPKATS
jgi:hypothetical protein